TVAHLAVIRLRQTQPDAERPFRGPGVIRFRGRELPTFAVLGGLGTLIAFLTVAILNPVIAADGFGWIRIGALFYPWYRKRQGLDLTTTHKIAAVKPVVEHEAEYESVLVAFETSDYVPEAVATAMKIAATRKRGIHILVTITVPATSPIDAELP